MNIGTHTQTHIHIHKGGYIQREKVSEYIENTFGVSCGSLSNISSNPTPPPPPPTTPPPPSTPPPPPPQHKQTHTNTHISTTPHPSTKNNSHKHKTTFLCITWVMVIHTLHIARWQLNVTGNIFECTDCPKPSLNFMVCVIFHDYIKLSTGKASRFTI